MYSRLSAPMELSQILLAFCTLVSCTSRACGQLSLYPFSALTGSVVDGKLQINLTFSSWSTDFSETYTLPSDSIFADASTSWYWTNTRKLSITLAPTSPATQDLCRIKVRQDNDSVLSVKNSYERYVPCNGGCQCPYTAVLEQNSSTYSCFLVAAMPRTFSLQVNVSQEDSDTASLSFTPWDYAFGNIVPDQVEGPFVNGSAAIKNVTYKPRLRFGTDWPKLQQRWCLEESHHNYSDSGFMVPFAAFGGGANQIGINQSQFELCRNAYSEISPNCSAEPFGACTQVEGGSPFNQFEAFRSSRLGSLIPVDKSWHCTLVGNEFLDSGQPPTFASNFRCNYDHAYLHVNLSIDAISNGLLYGRSMLKVANTSISNWMPKLGKGAVSILLENTGNITGQFSITAMSCMALSNTLIASSVPVTHDIPAHQAVAFSLPFRIGSQNRQQCILEASDINTKEVKYVNIDFLPVDINSNLEVMQPSEHIEAGKIKWIPYLNCTFSFDADYRFISSFATRLVYALGQSAGVPATNVFPLDDSLADCNHLTSILRVQIQFPYSNSLEAPHNLRLVLIADARSAFRSDIGLLSYIKDVSFIASEASEGFILLTPTKVNAYNYSSRSPDWVFAIAVLIALTVGCLMPNATSPIEATRSVYNRICKAVTAFKLRVFL